MDPYLALDHLILERATLYASLLGLSEAELTTCPLCGTWTAKDVLAHIAGWESRAARSLPALLAGRGMEIADEPDDDACNAQLVAQRRGLPFAAVLAELEQVLADITAILDPLPPELLTQTHRVPWAETSAARWVRLEADHEAEHTASILAWRRQAQPERLPGPRPLAIAAIRNARWALQRLTGRLPAATRDTAPLCGNWTAKDVIGHLADWTGTMATAAARAPQLAKLPALPETDDALDAWNTEHAASRRSQPWPAVWAAYDAACSQAIAALERLDDRALAHPYPGAMPPTLYQWLTITGHDVEHAQQILAWLEAA